MILHYFKLIWNRRRANALILVEVLISFLVLSAVLTTGVYFLERWSRPLGFEWRDVWQVEMDHEQYNVDDREVRLRILETTRMIQASIAAMPQVELAAVAGNIPYSGNSNEGTMRVLGEDTNVLTCQVSTEAKDVLRLNLVAGRWHEKGDEALGWEPVVLSRNLARDWFGNEDPVGKFIPKVDDNGEPRPNEPGDERVIGVVEDYRRDGELARLRYAMFTHARLDDPAGYPPSSLIVRLVPGTPAAFEEDLMRALDRLDPEGTFGITPLWKMRRDRLMSQVLPLLIVSAVSAFLVAMVGLGLVGVLWQSVARRTQEIGVRRALGATAGTVRLQVLGELLALTTVAVVVGAAIFFQFPILGVVSFVSLGVYVVAFLASLTVLYAFVILCGLYPSWLATRVHPARALQYE